MQTFNITTLTTAENEIDAQKIKAVLQIIANQEKTMLLKACDKIIKNPKLITKGLKYIS